MSAIRQLLATGVLNFANPFDMTQMIFEIRIIPAEYVISMFSQPVGAFFTFAILAAGVAAYKNHLEAKAKEQEKAEAALKKAAKEA